MFDLQPKRLKGVLTVAVFSLASILCFGLGWLFVLAPKVGDGLGVFGWYLFSFGSGISMIVLPCTLPLLFVIVPLATGKGLARGVSVAVAFGLGLVVTLSLYGALVSVVGKVGLHYLGTGVEDVKNWVYFFSGIFAYVFALAEIGLVKFRIPTYGGHAPEFIQQRKDYLKAFLLGILLGNIGVGCPHPATPLLLTEAATSGNIYFGASLFIVHAIGRVLPLILSALLAVLGVNSLEWLLARKEKIQVVSGWVMVFVAGFIMTLGLFTHVWWVNSGQHSFFEMVTQEEYVTDIVNLEFRGNTVHLHQMQSGAGIFGQPLVLGNYFLVLLWLLPIWWQYARERKRVLKTPALAIMRIEKKIDMLEQERRGLEVVLHIREGSQGARYRQLETAIDTLEKERRVYEEAIRFGVEGGMRDKREQEYEEKLLSLRCYWYATITLLLVLLIIVFLPYWFNGVL